MRTRTTEQRLHKVTGRARLVTGLGSLALLAAWATAIVAQDGQGGGEPPLFVGRVDVSVVNVDVFVTDADGNPATDLTVEDFVLLQDGQPVEISNFYAATRPSRLEANIAADAPSSSRPPEEAAFLPSDRQLNLIVYVDHTNLRPETRKRVLDDMRGFLTERAYEGDNIMLVGYDGGVEVVLPFTRDDSRIRQGLDSLGKVATGRQIDDLERRRILSRIAEAASDTFNRAGDSRPIDGRNTAYSAIRGYVQERRSEMRQTVRALNDTLRALAGVPGRKAMFYISDGLPQRPGEELFQAMADLFDNGGLSEPIIDPTIEALRDDQGFVFDELIREANAQQVTFYPIDARGTRGENRLSSAFANQSGGDAGNSFLEGMAELNMQEPLIAMADATGGTTILNTFNFDQALESNSRAFDTFYSLGYTLPEGGDGAFHDLQVLVRRPGFKVRHRSGYQDKPEAERVADRTLSSLFLEAGDNPLGIGVFFGEAEKEKGDYVLPVLVRIPFAGITLLPEGEARRGQLQIFVAVRDEKGRLSAMHQQPYPVSLTEAEAAKASGQDIGYGRQLKLRPGTATIAVGVWDEVSGTKSFVQERVLIGNRRMADRDSRRGAGR